LSCTRLSTATPEASLHRNRNLATPTPLHKQPILTPGTISTATNPYTYPYPAPAPALSAAASCTWFTAQTSRPRPYSTQACKLGGVHLSSRRPLPLSLRFSPTSNKPSSRVFNHNPCTARSFSSTSATMSTLSQPQTPSTLDSPLREHRHRPVEKLTDKLETPSLDDRSYRVIRLPNQLEVLLVHDAETDKASAAMDVNVGNFSDEEDMPGMAHAVEHLLFMGTKKYPVENAYSQYLSSHSGSSNAYTGATSTNYYFEVAAKPAEDASSNESSPLYGALDRFAQFFIDPLFLSSTLDRELRAVDSENKKNLQSDQWRLHQLEKALSNPKHPYCHFSTGNFEVLKTQPEERGVDVRQKFMDFHEKHYSANRMKLVILGREPLDTLEGWAADLFAGVRNKDLTQNRWETEVPFGANDLLTQCFAKPVMDSRELDLSFPFVDEEQLFESQPSRYISHLIGHEGPGSIMSYIKAKGWANGLSAGAYPVCPGTPGIFNCQIRLTEDGLKNYQEIVKVFFQYVSLLRETPPQEWIFQEQKGLAEVDFKFKQKTPAERFTSKISAVMQTPLPRQWLLSGHSRLRKFDPARIEEGLACLRPDNFRMTVVSQKFPGSWESKEKWYGTEYTYEKIPADFIAEIKRAATSTTKNRLTELHLPHANQFIPTKLEVEKKEISEPAISPKLIRNDDLVRTWYKKDDTFWVPKANLFVNCRNTLPNATAENSLKARLFTDVVRDALEEYSYDAELAGLDYSISSHSMGIEIAVSGYNDKLSVLLEKVLVTMRDLVIKPERFEIIKERLLRGLKNWDFQQPFNQVGDFTRWLNNEKGYINEQILAELPHLTAADIQQFFPHLLRQMHIETFVHGNLYKEDALKLTDLIESILKPRVLPQTQWPVSRSLVFPPGGNYVYHKTLKDPANVNHCIEYLLFVGDKSQRPLRAKTLLLDQMTHEPAFDQLRTKEQLGYVVFSGARTTSTTIGYRFIIQSEKTPEYLESRIDSFLSGFASTLAQMTDSDFESHKRSLITKRLEKLKNLDQESSRLWNYIDSEYLDFELVREDAANVRLLTKADMVEFYSHFILPTSPARSKLAIHLNAQTPTTNGDSTVTAAVEKGMKVLGLNKDKTEQPQTLALNKDKKDAEDGEVVPVKTEGNGTTPYIITDVREFKSKLQVSAGPQPVKHISSFEELDAKL
ncbi:putative zinc protease, partial [Lachnellula suecica]